MNSGAVGRQLTLAEAMKEALAVSLEEDAETFVIGEDVGVMGGVAGQTRGLYEKFGEFQLIDAPISEAAFFGLSAGAAQHGFRPIIELMRVDFFGVAMDQIYNYIAKIGYCTNGSRRAPVTVITQVGNPLRQGAVHAQTLFGTFAHLPGLKLVAPSTSFDAKGLLRSAILSEDPVFFFFHASLLAIPYGNGLEEWTAIEVPEHDYTVPIGSARIIRSGSDITVVSLSHAVHECLRAAQELDLVGVSCEVIDLRSVVPLDIETVVASVERTRRLAVIDEDYIGFGLSGEILACVAERGLGLSSPPIRVARGQVPIPFSGVLDDEVRPTVRRIASSIAGAVLNDVSMS